jgi:drug/metabolite transporter (DMT)-like permease
MEVVFGALVGWIIYQETLGIWALVGGALILIGAILPQLKKNKTS